MYNAIVLLDEAFFNRGTCQAPLTETVNDNVLNGGFGLCLCSKKRMNWVSRRSVLKKQREQRVDYAKTRDIISLTGIPCTDERQFEKNTNIKLVIRHNKKFYVSFS